ncbi:hypothetical protein ACH5RR_019370 [Cinchona calisaya]|uniref:Non-haem dioxygenase N-terminal domain-containing protein n=1 Tax=Cinchona calisaya TaxID=153742 RepID=A0ABD2ZP81_9GENT
MTSSAHKHHHHLQNPYGTTAAPPPTPSAQPNLLSTSEAADALSCLLHRLPPTLSLSLPTRRSSPPTTTPLISLSDTPETLQSNLLSASSKLGFFQLTNHSIPSQLAESAESDALSLFNLSHDEKQLHFPKNWPLGYDNAADDDDDEEESTSSGESLFCLDSTCFSESTELNLTSLREFTAQMEKLGLELVEELSCAFGFDNPARQDPTKVCSLMWISEGNSSDDRPALSGRMYPYVVGLQYQIRCQKYSMLTDSGWTSASPNLESVLVTLGDIAQVWSNGKIKKVRGRPIPNLAGANNSRCVLLTLFITLPMDSTVSPLLPKLDGGNGDESNAEDDDNSAKEERIFNPFSLEDYAWRIYHERLHSKDPLVRYRV